MPGFSGGFAGLSPAIGVDFGGSEEVARRAVNTRAVAHKGKASRVSSWQGIISEPKAAV